MKEKDVCGERKRERDRERERKERKPNVSKQTDENRHQVCGVRYTSDSAKFWIAFAFRFDDVYAKKNAKESERGVAGRERGNKSTREKGEGKRARRTPRKGQMDGASEREREKEKGGRRRRGTGEKATAKG